MKDFEEIKKEDVLLRLINGDEVFAYVLTVTANNNVTSIVKRLKNETLDVITKIIDSANVAFFIRKKE